MDLNSLLTHWFHPQPRPMTSTTTNILQSIFLTRSETSNPLYRSTLGLCTLVSAATFLADTKVIFTQAGGNRFAIETALDEQRRLSDHFTLSRTGVFKGGRWYTLISSVFNHAGLAHFAGNVYGIYTVGKVLRTGPFLVVFYGGCVLGNLLCLALDARTGRVVGKSVAGRKIRAPGVYLGASGGVAALMAFMSCCFPTTSVTVYLPVPLTLPFWMHTLGFAVYCSWAQLAEADEGIAHLGHLGGIVWGVAYFVARFRRLPWVSHTVFG